MQFVKTHWMSLAAGVVALAAIVLAVIGMTRDAVVQEMQQRLQAAAEINSLRSDPQNEETIAAEKLRAQIFAKEYEKVVQAAEQINQRQPLLEGVFPKPAQLELPYRFRQSYVRKFYELPRVLRAGSLPTEAEIQDEAEILADLERRKRAEEGETAGAEAPPSNFLPGAPPSPGPTDGRGMAPPGPTGGRGMAPPGPVGGRGMAPPGPVGGRGMAPPGPVGGRGMAPPGAGAPAAGGTAPPIGVEASVVQQRAAVKKARNIRIYADPETSFQVSPIAHAETPPTPREMWYAQVSLWVQEDLVNAIARLNEEAAQKLGEEHGNVTNLPVKRIESIAVQGYVRADGVLVPLISGVGAQQLPEGAVGGPVVQSFTGRRSDQQFDVIRVQMTVIVDKRELLRLIDAVTRTNFYQLVGVEYSTVENVDPAGYYYGSAPVVRAVLDFEGYLARKIFKPLMPAEVLADLGIEGAEGQAPQQ